jgi:hypothetical protein
LVEGARDRIEELPPIARARRKRQDRKWLVVAIVAAVGLIVLIVGRRQRSATAGQLDEPIRGVS